RARRTASAFCSAVKVRLGLRDKGTSKVIVTFFRLSFKPGEFQADRARKIGQAHLGNVICALYSFP
ncbi:MAG: hypothetical protein DWQ01_00470, partial [Planctomycetota bacterium]